MITDGILLFIKTKNMKKSEYIEVFNAMIRGTPVSFREKLLPIVSEYLTENNIENSDKLINFIAQNPQLIQQTIPKMIDYFSRKYNIFSLILNNKTILYYE